MKNISTALSTLLDGKEFVGENRPNGEIVFTDKSLEPTNVTKVDVGSTTDNNE